MLGFTPGRRARASRRRLNPLRSLVISALAVILAAASGSLAYFLPAAMIAFNASGASIDLPSPSPTSILFSPTPSASSAPTVATSGAFTVLLLGSDDDSKFSGDRVLTQSMILVRVVPSTKQVTMLSIPRDLWAPLATGGTGKMDWAYSYGGARAAIATVQADFGVHINDYIWVGLLGLIRVIDVIGGIDIVTSNPVLDDYYPLDVNTKSLYGYQRIAVLGGPQHLDGTHALEYVRSRHNDLQSDFGRSRRQQQVLLAIRAKSKLLSAEDIPSLAQAIGGEIKTSISLDKVASLLPLAASLDNPANIHTIVLASPYTHGGAPDGSLWPSWGLILPLVHQYFP
ncbi:MAG TPA: LCP family protein [Candidatus Dormibacteraeota bacterium]|nr:LCP family protein [Candidatus Dormibacteraeota bacterium]